MSNTPQSGIEVPKTGNELDPGASDTLQVKGQVNWFQVWIISICAISLIEFYLDTRQLKNTYITKLPKVLKKHVKKAEFIKCQKYSRAKGQFGLLSSYLSLILQLIVWCFGWPAAIWAWTDPWVRSFTTTDLSYDFCQGMLLMIFTGLIEFGLSGPLSLIMMFLIQESFGYNNQTLCGWVKDLFLGLALNMVLTPLLVYALLWIIYTTGDAFVYWACLFITCFALLMLVIAPLVIMPMFNKFDPLEENIMKKDVERLATSIDFPLSKVEVVDGSKRSGHSNAFQYGFGKIKKIVLFDTLMEQHLGVKDEAKKADDLKSVDKQSQIADDTSKRNGQDSSGEEADVKDEAATEKKIYKQSDYKYDNSKGRLEILAVVAHELGHWMHMDTLKLLVFGLIKIYAIFFAFSYAITATDMPKDFGFQKETKFLSLILFFMLCEPIFYILGVFNTLMTRRVEFQADEFSVDQGYGPYLYSGLIALFVNNSGNLNPDWLYAALKYDHPALIERLAAIENRMSKVVKYKENESAPLIPNFAQTSELYIEQFKETMEKRHPEAMGVRDTDGQSNKLEGGEPEKQVTKEALMKDDDAYVALK